MDLVPAALSPLQAIATDPRSGPLVALLLVATWIDWRTMRIPNWLTLGGVLVGFGVQATSAAGVGDGLAGAALGLLVGFAALLPLYALRVLGAGDVKLMAMAGSFLGAAGAGVAVLLVFMVGGVAAIAYALAHRVMGKALLNIGGMLHAVTTPGMPLRLPAGASAGRLPYAASIAGGVILFLVLRGLGFAWAR